MDKHTMEYMRAIHQIGLEGHEDGEEGIAVADTAKAYELGVCETVSAADVMAFCCHAIEQDAELESLRSELAARDAEVERLREERRGARAKLPTQIVGAVLGTDIDGGECLAVCLCTYLSDSVSRPDEDQDLPPDDEYGWTPWVIERYEEIRKTLTEDVAMCVAERLPRAEAAEAAKEGERG